MNRRGIALFLLFVAGIAGLALAGYWLHTMQAVEWQATIKDRYGLARESLAAALLKLAIALPALWLLGYGLSFDRRRARPWAAILIGAVGAGAGAGALLRQPLFEYDFLTRDPFTDSIAYAWAGGLAGGLAVAVLAFEFAMRALFTMVGERADASGNTAVALTANRGLLLFRPGAKSLLGVVALADFRSGDREAAPATLEALYAEGRRDPELLEALCQWAYEAKQQDRYLEYLTALQAAVPKDAALQRGLIGELLEQGRVPEALAFIDKNGMPEDADTREKIAAALLNAGDYPRAVETIRHIAAEEGIPFRASQRLLRELLSRATEYVPALNLLAEQAERMGMREQRLRWLEKSLEADPRQNRIRDTLREIYTASGDTMKRLRLLRDIVQQNPMDDEAWLELVAALQSSGQVDEAIAELDKYHTKHKANAASALQEVGLLFERGSLDLVDAALTRAESASGAAAHRDRIASYRARLERALMTAELAAKMDRARENPDDLQLQLDVIERLIREGHAEKAISFSDPLIHRAPAARAEIIRLLQAHREAEEVSYSLLDYLENLEVQAGQFDSALVTVRAMMRRSIEPLAALREGTQRVLARSPHHLATLKMLGDRFAEEGRFTDMIHHYSLYLSNGGEETPELRRSLAIAYIALRDFTSAKRFMPLAMGASEPGLLKKLIPLALEAGEPETAADYLKALELVEPAGEQTKELKKAVAEGLGNKRFAFLQREIEAGKGGAESLEQLGDIARELENFNDAITYYQRASREPSVARRAKAKLAWVFAKKKIFDLASETLGEISLSMEGDPEEMSLLMDLIYEIATMFQEAKMHDRSLRLYKLLLKIDAGYRDVLKKVEVLG